MYISRNFVFIDEGAAVVVGVVFGKGEGTVTTIHLSVLSSPIIIGGIIYSIVFICRCFKATNRQADQEWRWWRRSLFCCD